MFIGSDWLGSNALEYNMVQIARETIETPIQLSYCTIYAAIHMLLVHMVMKLDHTFRMCLFTAFNIRGPKLFNVITV